MAEEEGENDPAILKGQKKTQKKAQGKSQKAKNQVTFDMADKVEIIPRRSIEADENEPDELVVESNKKTKKTIKSK